MLNILIVEDDIHQLSQIVNTLSFKDYNLKIYCIASSGEEALSLIKTKDIDIIILDLKLSGMSGVDLIREIEHENLVQYKKSIIVISGDSILIQEIYNSYYVYTCLLKPFNTEELFSAIEQIITNRVQYSNIKEKIRNELDKLQFNPIYDGTRYLEDCIFQIYVLGESNLDNLSQKVYPMLADKYNKTSGTIYGNIKQSINAMFYDCNEELLKDYFKYSFIVKPKPKEIIYAVLNRICS